MPGSPVNIALPKVSGTPLVGQTLTAEEGTWVGTPPISYAYQWYACSLLSGCEPIAGETEQTHAVGLGEFGDSFEVEVTATNAQGSASAISEQTNVAGGNAPVNTEAPTVSGEAERRPAADGLERQMVGHRTDHVRIRMAALQHERAPNARRRPAASVLPTYLVVGRRRRPQAARQGDREKPRRQRRSRIGRRPRPSPGSGPRT